MRKTISTLLIFFLLLQVKLNSQTLTAANTNPFAGWGETFGAAWYALVPSGGSGQGQLWNYANTLGNVTSFNTAALQTTSGTSIYGFYANYSQLDHPTGSYLWIDSVQVSTVGLYTFGRDAYTDPEIIMTYPFSYGSTLMDSWTFTSSISSPSASPVTHTFTGTTTLTADGTGTLITPIGTYANILRTKSVQIAIEYQTSPANPVATFTNIVYRWYQPGVHREIMKTVDATDFTKKFINKHTEILTAPVSSVAKNSSQDFNFTVFPNPASSQIRLQLRDANKSGVTTCVLADLCGQAILERTYSGEEALELNVSSISCGVYFVQILNGTHVLGQKKVTILHE